MWRARYLSYIETIWAQLMNIEAHVHRSPAPSTSRWDQIITCHGASKQDDENSKQAEMLSSIILILKVREIRGPVNCFRDVSLIYVGKYILGCVE